MDILIAGLCGCAAGWLTMIASDRRARIQRKTIAEMGGAIDDLLVVVSKNNELFVALEARAIAAERLALERAKTLDLYKRFFTGAPS